MDVEGKFRRAFLDVLECRCWSNRRNNSPPGMPVRGAADTIYLAPGRRTHTPYAV